MFSSDRVAQLYLQAPGSLSVAYYESQGTVTSQKVSVSIRDIIAFLN
jgi:hypothetical protein